MRPLTYLWQCSYCQKTLEWPVILDAMAPLWRHCHESIQVSYCLHMNAIQNIHISLFWMYIRFISYISPYNQSMKTCARTMNIFHNWEKLRKITPCQYIHFTLVVSSTHWGRHKMDAVSQTTFSNTLSWTKMFQLKFHWSLLPRFQLIIPQHWFR